MTDPPTFQNPISRKTGFERGGAVGVVDAAEVATGPNKDARR